MALVKYNAKNVYSCLDVRLLPGVNEVGDALLKRVLDEPLFKWRVDEGIIEIIEKPKGKAKGSDNKQLIKLMPEVYDVKLLKRYIEESEDKEVVKVAKKQLKRIENVETVKTDEVEVGVTIK